MAVVAGSIRRSRSPRGATPVRPVAEAAVVGRRTTSAERWMLMATVVLLPLQTTISTIAGFSSAYLMFAAILGYVLLHRPRILDRTWMHPVFLTGYVLLILSALIEFAHANPNYLLWSRIASMIAGAVLVATLCRDRAALRAGIHGYLIAGLSMSVVALVTSYSALRDATPANFAEATLLRDSAFSDNPVILDLNDMAFITAQGAVVALAMGLTARSAVRRNLFFGILIMCLLATFLPMSRGGLVIIAVSCATVISVHGLNRARIIMTSIFVGVVLFMSVPGAVLSRLQYSPESPGDVRANLYGAVINALPDYIITGLGAGNYESWGLKNGLGFYMTLRAAKVVGLSEDSFTPGLYVLGTHNCFLQVTICWGLTALVALIAVVYQAYRSIPKRLGTDLLALSLYGIAISSLLEMMVVHMFAKQFAVALGLIVGSQLWIWAQPTGSPLRKEHSDRGGSPRMRS